jgi:hypothetical protein
LIINVVFAVTLQATGDADFRGYIIQARSGTETTGIGSFSAEGSQGKTMDCPGGTAVCHLMRYTKFYATFLMNLEYAQNAVTHSSRVRRKNETFLWTPPADFQGQVTMKLVIAIVKF